MKKSISINYIFFSFFLIFFIFLNFLHLNFLENNKTIFIIHSSFQNILQISIAIILFKIFEKYLSKNLFRIFICIFLFLIIIKIVNFFMISIMDLSFTYAIKMLFGDGIGGIKRNIEAANINQTFILLIISISFIIPFLFIKFYEYSKKKKNLLFSKKNLLFFILFILITNIFLEISSKNFSYNYKKRLSFSFIKPKKRKITFIKNSKNLTEKETIKIIKNKNIELKKNPNIFIFIIEALRKDSINEKIAPSLFQFKKENIFSENSFSNANGTIKSWFSIFYSKFPNDWNFYRKNFSLGAPTLNLLKILDYKINVFSAADLKYFNMDKVLFGKKRGLLNKFVQFSDKKAYIRDKEAFEALKKNVSFSHNLFITFLDSTHSEYSFPDEKNPKFFPIRKNINYINLCYSHRDLPFIKNRYFNSINYLDNLFKDFFTFLKEKNLYKDAIIIITADHGEEFFENGAIFHSSHLNNCQINIPIIYKLDKKPDTKNYITSLVDIFPTIFDSILQNNKNFSKIFDGKSIFTYSKDKICISANESGIKNPEKFLIFYKNQKILTNLKKRKENFIFEIISIKDMNDKEIKNKNINHKKLLEAVKNIF